MRLDIGAQTDVGCVREANEDSFCIMPDIELFVLADGVGGKAHGEVASRLAVDHVTGHCRQAWEGHPPPFQGEIRQDLSDRSNQLASAIRLANRAIRESAASDPSLRGMGTTVAAAWLTSNKLSIAHVGDSRCYRWRDGMLEQLTHDHSLINDALEMRPDIDDKALAKLPQNVVTRALGMEPNVRVSVRTYRILAGDKYLMCSDGLSDTLDEDTLSDVLAVDRSSDEIVRTLITKSLEQGARDNIAAVVISCALDAGAVAVPRVPVLVRHPTSAPPPGGAVDGDPEIVILSEDDVDGQIHVVPSDTAGDDVIEALEDFSKNR